MSDDLLPESDLALNLNLRFDFLRLEEARIDEAIEVFGRMEGIHTIV